MFIKNTVWFSKSYISSKSNATQGNDFFRCLSHRGLRRLSTATLFGASYFCHYVFSLVLKLQTIPNRRRQTWPKKPSSKIRHRRSLPREERNINNIFLEVLVDIVLNNKTVSTDNNMTYVYYPKLLKDYGSDLLSWIYNTPVDHIRSV